MFCLADVCKALEIKNTSDVKTRLKEDGVGTAEVIDALGRTQTATFVSEANLYKCIFQSRKPEAEQFQDWVCDEVLPSIRKHGAYATPRTIDSLLADPDNAIKLFQTLKEERQLRRIAETRTEELEAVNTEQAKAISEMSPKVNYCDIILKSPSTVVVSMIAQDYGMSGKAFNKLLHTLGIQHKVGGVWVLYAEHIAAGYVQSATEPMKNSQHGRSYSYTRWTQKGRLFLYETLKKKGILPLIEK